MCVCDRSTCSVTSHRVVKRIAEILYIKAKELFWYFGSSQASFRLNVHEGTLFYIYLFICFKNMMV